MKNFGKDFESMRLYPSGICFNTNFQSTLKFHTKFMSNNINVQNKSVSLYKQKFVNSQLANGFPIHCGFHLSQTAKSLTLRSKDMCKINGGMNMKVIEENLEEVCMNCTKEANYSFHFCSCCMSDIDLVKRIGV